MSLMYADDSGSIGESSLSGDSITLIFLDLLPLDKNFMLLRSAMLLVGVEHYAFADDLSIMCLFAYFE